MSEETVAANQSSTEATDVGTDTNQSTETTATTDTQNNDFQRDIDSDWGITTDEEPEEEALEDSEVEDEQEDEEEQVTEEPEEEDAQDSADTALTVNFLGQSYNLTEDEARRYAQIGMNAGRMQEKLDSLRPLEPLKEAIEVMALFHGKTPDEIIQSISNMDDLRANEINALVENGHDEALATELFESRYAEAKQKAELNRLKKPEEKGLSASQIEQIERFSKFRPKEHEDITAGKAIPDDVVAEWKNGTDLTTAWLLHENKEYTSSNNELKKQINDLTKQLKDAQKELKKATKNAENKSKAPTRKKGTGGGNASGTDIYASWKVF